MVINVIDEVLSRPGTYEEKVALFEKYANKPGLLKTFQNRKDRQTRQMLDYELKRLRWKAGIPIFKKNHEKNFYPEDLKPKGFWKKMAEEIPRFNFVNMGGRVEDIPSVFDWDMEADGRVMQINRPIKKRLYPPVIEECINLRSSSANERDKAGRALVEKADQLSQEERARLMEVQKNQHKVVMETTRIINVWKNEGKLPEEKKEESIWIEEAISEEALKELEKEWSFHLRKVSLAKRNIEKFTKQENENKIDYHNMLLKKSDARLDELAKILGKTRRK